MWKHWIGKLLIRSLTIFCNFENVSGNLPFSEFVVFLFANTTEFGQVDENEIIIYAGLEKIIMPRSVLFSENILCATYVF